MSWLRKTPAGPPAGGEGPACAQAHSPARRQRQQPAPVRAPSAPPPAAEDRGHLPSFGAPTAENEQHLPLPAQTAVLLASLSPTLADSLFRSGYLSVIDTFILSFV